MAYLLKRWGLTSHDLLSFGDGGNDIEMLAFAQHSYAMSNASPDLKAIAQKIAPSNDEEGVLSIIEDLLNTA